MHLRNFSLLLAALSFALLAVAVFMLALRDDPAQPIHVHVAAPPVVPPAVTVNPPEPAPDDGLRVLHLGTTSGGESTIAVVRRAASVSRPAETGWTLTFYKFSEYRDRGYLRHMGTRYIEDDMGFDHANLHTQSGWSPDSFRQLREKLRTMHEDSD